MERSIKELIGAQSELSSLHQGESWDIKAQVIISELEHAKHTILFNSGISTITAILSILPTSTSIIVPDDFYSGTRHLIGKIFASRFKSIAIKPCPDHVSNIENLLS